MARRFSADNSEVRAPVGANTTGAYSIALLCRRATATSGAYGCLIAGHTSAGLGTGAAIEYGDSASVYGDRPVLFTNGDSGSKPAAWTGTVADGAMILVLTKASGTVAPNWHKFVFSASAGAGAWTGPTAGDNTSANAPTIAGGSWRVGEFEDIDDLDGYVALSAIWAGTALSTAQVQALSTNRNTSDWTGHAVPPTQLFQFNQAVATDDIPDLMGGTTITGAISGTTDNNGIAGTTITTTDTFGGWTFTGGAAPTVKKLAALGVG